MERLGPRSAGDPPGALRGALQEGLDALADALIVMVRRQDESGSAARSRGGASGRQGLVGEV
jgi:hypothetical protein